MSIDYSLIIPAYNEEAYLPATLKQASQAMLAQDIKGELIVVDNNSADRSAEIAREAGATVVHEAINQIARARNAGAAAARGRYLLFLDADTHLSEALLNAALDKLETSSVCGGGARVAFDSEVDWFPQKVLDFWNWYSLRRQTAAGCFIYCLKQAFDEVGGFSESVYASEEIWLCMALRKWAKTRQMDFSIISEHPIITSNRKLLWYSNTNLVMQSLPNLLCPPLLRVQYFCQHWYKRP